MVIAVKRAEYVDREQIRFQRELKIRTEGVKAKRNVQQVCA